MADRILDYDLTADQIAALELTKTRHLEEDDTQEVTIDFTYAMCWMSEMESEFAPDDPEVVELIGVNADRPCP